MERLQSFRQKILEDKKVEDDYKTEIQQLKAKKRIIMGSAYEDSDDECGSDDDISGESFAARMMAARNGTVPKEVSESCDTDSDWGSYEANKPRKRKPFQHYLIGLSVLRDFEDCDLTILDGLNIKDWEKMALLSSHLKSINVPQ